ncbi:MAG TPA: beta-ketoacyl synthase N-terminal-like domain-containing protein, partial [Polyangium sp.]|nr:beta-ketoacyl synthase N-terminal-like domain-containing protein [Polyangium sp.]
MTTESNDFKELLRRALAKVNDLKAELAARDAAQNEPIAVIGMACRIPGGGHTPETFWQSLCKGIDTVKRLPPDRWVAEALSSNYPESKWASVLDTETIERFDAEFFSISGREATCLDPQQRLLLEVAWEALENAGQSASAIAGTRTGVYVGMWRSDYSSYMAMLGIHDGHIATGTLHSAASGRISYVLGLQGPSMTIDTACSSSLVTVHEACQSLRVRESDMALAGGSNIILDPEVMRLVPATHAVSPDGQCKSFDAQANGYVRGEGCGMLVLKRLSDAERDGDPILGVILSSAVNQDGRSTGLTVPNVLAQQALIREALQKAKLDPADIGYVETHGTGTSLGDPIEFEALRGTIGAPRADGSSCILGAVKTNIGHTETAAGVIGMIKTLLCLNHEEIPKNIHFETLNPRITLEGTPFVIPTEHRKWPAGAKPRRAGVSAFGIAGTNAHVIVQEAPKGPTLAVDTAESTYVLPLSARTPAALDAVVGAYLAYLPTAKDSLADIVYTAACRRSHLEHRLAVLGRSKDEFVVALEQHIAGKPSGRLLQGKLSGREPQVVFAFSGQGAQWIGMGRELLQQSPRFRQTVESCEKLIMAAGGSSVITELEKAEGESLLQRTEVAQPALFSIQVGIAAELQARGVQPAIVIGHSVGEVAAAYVAGLLDLETACRVVVARAMGMKDQAGRGKMYAVDMTEAEALAFLQGESAEVGVAACNGPRSVVLAGETSALQRVVQKLENQGTKTKELRVDYAFHSPQMAEAEQFFLRTVGPIVAKRSAVKMISSVTGQELKASDCNAAYWGRNIRQPVRFAQAIAETLRIPGRVFVEIGPHPVLSADIGEQLANARYTGKVMATLRRNQAGQDQILTTLANLHVQGVAVSWSAEFASRRRVVALPNYPWQRKRYFFDIPKAQAKQPGVASQYYDAVTKLVETVQGPGQTEEKDKYDLYLTFAPLTEIVPGLSWMKVVAKPNEHQEQADFIQEKQLEMRQVLFRHVDFDKCARALDFGCGFSTDILHLAQKHPQLTLDGYTISAEQAEVGNRRSMTRGLNERVHVYNRDSGKDAFPNKYDLVFGFEVAHHIKDKAALFGNIRDHANEGATLVLADFISHVGFEIEHDASSSFFLTVDQWTELLAGAEFELQDIVDCSRQISNFLYDPDFDAHLEQMRQGGEDENVLIGFQSYDRLGKMLDRGLSSYILLSAKKVSGKSVEELREHNRTVLTNLTPYTAPGADGADNELLFGVEWRRTPLPHEAQPGDGWLLVAEREETTAGLAEQLAQHGVRVVRAHAGEGYAQAGPDHYRMQISTAHTQRLLQEAFGHEKPLTRVVYLHALEMPESTSAGELSKQGIDLCGDTTSLVQGLVTHGFRTFPRLYLVTRGACAVGSSS